MKEFRALLLDVWREACRHIEIERSAEVITNSLRTRLPIGALEVIAFDWPRSLVITIAQVPVEGRGKLPRPSRTLTPAERRHLQEWIRAHALTRAEGADPHGVRPLLLGDPLASDLILVPLSSEHGAQGALLVRADGDARFLAEHADMVAALMEPFSVALENDRRLHESNALREAAEAEKRSALTRLGRDGLTDVIVGADAGLRPVMARVALVAPSDLPVLILGATGSGKELIARAIHEQSPRRHGPFIRVNCGAIPPELIDSELFGHEKGSFTGATTQRRGWFERADQGTLLLDEIGDLPLPAQVRLLRVLQEGVFERVGGERSVHVDVRIVAATHRDLPAMIRDGRFREDLWYRVAGFPILLPLLRERREDLPALAAHFADRAARRYGLRTQLPSQADLAMLLEYEWPGNIRELSSVIDRAAILGEGERLEIAAALGGIAAAHPPALYHPPGAAPRPEAHLPLETAMRRHIEGVLTVTRGRIEGAHGAARLLQINPHTLRSRMRKLGIERGRFRDPGDLP